MAESRAGALLEELAPSLGLDPAPPRFPREGDLAARLASHPFLMAPMAGVSDAAYRLMARAGGASLAWSEMVSVAGLHYGGAKTWELAVPDPAEPDLAVQLFGSEPALFREAAASVLDRLGDRLALLDVNMACPVPKVTRKGEGSALLDDPERAAAIVRACVEGAGGAVPVTVKIRVGRRPGAVVGPSFARRMQEAGAAAVAVHGRFASQLYRGRSDRGLVADVVRAVDVPVVASGDVSDERAALEVMRETGAAAAFFARGSYGDPWVFSRAARLAAGLGTLPPAPADRVAALALHVRLLDACGAHLARARSLAGWYLKGLPGAARLRARAFECVTLDDYLAFCAEAAAAAGEGA